MDDSTAKSTAVVRVMMVAPSDTGRGGMCSVLSSLLGWKQDLLPEYTVELAPTHPGLAERTPASALRSLWMTFRTTASVIRTRPEIVHVFLAGRGSLVRKLLVAHAARAVGSRVLLHLHSGDLDRALAGNRVAGVPEPLLRAILHASDLVAVLSDETAAAAHSPRPVLTLPNPVEHTDAPRSYDRDYDVAFVGRLVTEKGADLLPGILAKIMELRPHTSIVIAGEPTGPVGKGALRLLHNQRGVTYLGWVSEEQVLDTLRRSRVLLVPSRVESVPLAVLKAASAGCYVVASPVGILPELLDNGRGSVVVGGPEAWGTTTVGILESLSPDVPPAPRLREYVLSRYSRENTVAGLKAAYDSLATKESH